MARLEAPVTNTRRRAPAASASSTAYWMRGLSTTGSISLGLALVAGSKRVPRPATGNAAVRIADFKAVLIAVSPVLLAGECSRCPARLHAARRRHETRTTCSARSAHLITAGRMLSQEWHFGQRQYQPTLFSPQ